MKNVFTFKNIQLAIVAGVFVFLAMYVVAPQVTQTFNTAEACCGSDGGSGGGGGGNQGGGEDRPKPDCKYLKSDKASVPAGGGNVTLSWSTTNGQTARLTPDGSNVPVNGSKTVNVKNDTNFVLQVFSRGFSDQCQVKVIVDKPLPAPTCDSFKAAPGTLPYGGGNVTLTWVTTNADDVSINQGVGPVSADGSKVISTTETKTYTLTAKGNGKQVQCPVTVKVEEPSPVPKCESFTANPSVLPHPGGNVTLTWDTSNANSVKLDGEAVSLDGSKIVSVTGDKTFTLLVNNGDDSCTASVKVEKEDKVPSCEMSATPMTIKKGESATLTWTSNHVTMATIDQGVGTVNPNGSVNVSPLETTVYKFTGKAADNRYVYCPVTVKVEEKPEEKECKLQITKSVNKEEAKIGDELTYTINVKNIGNGDCTGGGVKIVDVHDTGLQYVSETHSDNLSAGYNATPLYSAGSRTLIWNGHTLTPGEHGTITWIGKVKEREQCGNFEVVNQAKTTAKELNNFKTWVYSDEVNTLITNKCEEKEPMCEMFGNPTSIKKGESSTLTWTSQEVFAASIDQGIGTVSLNGSKDVSPATTTTYTFKGTYGTDDFVQCPVTITVTEEPEPEAPTCDSFTATPNSFNNGVGGGVTLTWATTNADSVTINQGVGSVAVDGSTGTSVTDDTTFTLTAVKGDKSASCPVTVTVTDPETPTLSCDSFTASPTSLPVGGGSTVLAWTTTDATDVSINNGVGTVAADGNTTVNVTAETTYTLTVRDDLGNTKSCDATVLVETGGGGGGGGSSSPRCELTISDTKIKSGEEVTISWDNTRTNDMVLEDNRGNVLIDTEKTTNYDEDEDSIKVKPTRDTEYTMTVSRGSRDRVCRVEVEIEDDVTVISTRTQVPQVAGIALTQVPYTGFEAGPFLTLLFYSLLAVWAAFIAYMIVVKERTVAGISLNGNNTAAAKSDGAWEDIVDQMHDNLEKEDNGVVAATAVATPSISPTMTDAGTPANLPTGEAPVMGYKSLVENIAPVDEEVVDTMTDLENAAHLKQALLSSDAINYFMDNYSDEEARFEALTKTIEKAKGEFPSEGGWMVLNLERVQELNKVDATAEATRFVPDTRVGVSSLAEAIVTGNVAAAYDLIGNRPMFALADAAADLDAVYRARKGMDAEVSSLLATSSAKLSDTQIEAMIKALTSALDGAYTDEESAVKMALMKAIKASS